MSASYVSSRIVAGVLSAAVACGADLDELCRASGVTRAELADVDGRLTPDVYLGALRAARARVTDPELAFRAVAIRPGSYNLLRFLCSTSATLHDALVRAARYLRSETDATSWQLTSDGALTRLRIERHVTAGAVESQLADELALADIVIRARDFTGRDISPVRVRFAFPAPRDPRRHQELFRCPIEFGAPATEMHWSAEVLALPLVAADDVAVAFFEHEIKKAIDHGATTDLVARVRREIAARVTGDDARLERVARSMAMSGRTLRRHLLAAGTSFQHLYDEARFAYATHCITRGDLPLGAIAIALGFSEPSAFHRAFRRWSGTTPQTYARQIRRTAKPRRISAARARS